MPTRASHKAARLPRLTALLEAGPRTATDLARRPTASRRTRTGHTSRGLAQAVAHGAVAEPDS